MGDFEEMFVFNPVYSEGLSFERHHAHEVINSFGKDNPFLTRTLFDIYFNYVSSKRKQGFYYDSLLEKLMYKVELSWIRENVPENSFAR